MITATQLIEKARCYIADFDEKKFRLACQFAESAHAGQLRKSGEPYIIHPLETANILMDYHVDEDTLIASILHDVPEDTSTTLREIEKAFGRKIVFLVQGITKISKVYYRHDMELRQIESLKRLLIHCAKDIRVLFIKLADRLHNMRTLGYILNPQKRTRIAKETLEIYVPIANLLGMGELKAEMEDLCFKNLYPKIYEELQREIDATKLNYTHHLEETKRVVIEELNKHNLSAKVEGRQKTLYSIYEKMHEQGKKLPEINDVLAVRVVTKSKEDCYKALGVIHSLFKPKPRNVKDYIAVPKTNGYQSLHTTVFGLNGVTTEFQIRTGKMHLEAEYGIAAHYFYKHQKELGIQSEKQFQKKTWWVHRILAVQRDMKNNRDFMENLRVDLFQDRIFTFTPKGDVIDLPKAASVLDFAYAIHTDIGNKASYGLVNGIKVKLNHELKTGDTVKIITDTLHAEPQREWLNYITTNNALNRIKEVLSKISREKKVQVGKSFLQKELSRAGKSIETELIPHRTAIILHLFHFEHVDELFIAIAEGNLDPKTIVKSLYEQEKSSEIIGTRLPLNSDSTQEVHYEAWIKVAILDRIGSLASVLSVLAKKNINLIQIKTKSYSRQGIYTARLRIEVVSFDQLSKIFEEMEDLDCVISVKRLLPRRRSIFLIWSGITTCAWILHFILIGYSTSHNRSNNLLGLAGTYVGILLLFGIILMLKQVLKKKIPDFSYTRTYWITSLVLISLASLVVIGEMFILQFPSHSGLLIFLLMFLLYAFLAVDYIDYRKIKVT